MAADPQWDHVADAFVTLAHRTGLTLAEAGDLLLLAGRSPVVGRGCSEAELDGDPPAVLGRVRERLLGPDDRRCQGAVYTPPACADGVVAQAVAGADLGPAPMVCDPAVGVGAFLLASARLLADRGLEPGHILADLLHGADADPLSVATTEAALVLWAWTTAGVAARPVAGHLAVGDSLLAGRTLWGRSAPAAGFDLVVGNPPFQSQLMGPTVRSRERARLLQAQWGKAASGYVDSAALFLVLATRLIRPGGRASLIVPESILGAHHAAAARAAVDSEAELVALWTADGPVFDAEVNVCAPVFQRRRKPRRARVVEASAVARDVRRTTGSSFAPLPGPHATVADAAPRTSSWNHLLGAVLGTPPVHLAAGVGVLADVATATAGFRDQFYDLVPFVVEAPVTDGSDGTDGAAEGGDGRTNPATGLAPLITSGLIDPGLSRWGQRSARFAGRRWERPAVDLRSLGEADAGIARWVSARLRPKVLLATQTRVIEAVADPLGTAVPSVPVIALEPHSPEGIWLLAAALLSPATSAWALREAAGASLAPDAIKLSARQTLTLPLPVDRSAWSSAAALLKAAAGRPGALDWPDFGRRMLSAYRLDPDDPLLSWWIERLPPADGARSRVRLGPTRTGRAVHA